MLPLSPLLFFFSCTRWLTVSRVHPGLRCTLVLVQLQEGQGKLLPEFWWPSHLPRHPARRLQHSIRLHGLHWGGIQTAGEIKWMNNARDALEGGETAASVSSGRWCAVHSDARHIPSETVANECTLERDLKRTGMNRPFRKKTFVELNSRCSVCRLFYVVVPDDWWLPLFACRFL